MISNDNFWMLEARRLLWVLLYGLIFGYITGYWQYCILLVGFGYIGWTLYKLYELQNWLAADQPIEKMPDSNGAWEQIAYLIQRGRKKGEARKKKHTELMLRFNSIMAALPDASILLDKDHVIQWTNPSALTLLGINDNQDYGQRVDNLVRVPCLTQLLEKPSDREIRFTSPRNEKITLSARLFQVQPGLNLLSVRDISQRIQLNKMRKAFIANASHELRTPLTVLTGYLELFEEDETLPEHIRPAVRQSRQQTKRMEQIIADLLVLSRLESPEMQATEEVTINMVAMLEKLQNAIQDTIAGSHEFSIKVDRTLKITGLEKDISSVVNNLLENAVKYTPAGTKIKVSWQTNIKGYACLTVEDNGPGIPAEHLPRLTERFYRVDKGRSRDKGGTGLGLAIV
ncbi:MAG: phosphate regulon sensor protein PhoR, partial [Thiolinea sp.]